MQAIIGYLTSEDCAACNPGMMVAIVQDGEFIVLTPSYVQGQCNNCNDRAGVSRSHVLTDQPVTEPASS